MTTINQYINRYKTDQEFKRESHIIAAGTLIVGVGLCTLLYIGTLIGYMY